MSVVSAGLFVFAPSYNKFNIIKVLRVSEVAARFTLDAMLETNGNRCRFKR